MKKFLKDMLETVLYILFVLIISFCIVKFVGQRTTVDGTSMINTLQDGDSLWVDKLCYKFDDPQRFDIVVFPYKYEEKTYYIKRVIGLPGETVHIDEEGNIYINGEVLEENYGREVIDANHIGLAENEITLGEDEYFVMGDNRNNSKDSRYPDVGNIKKDDLIGKAVFRMFPFKSMGKIKHQ